jgi:hypothetical protein
VKKSIFAVSSALMLVTQAIGFVADYNADFSLANGNPNGNWTYGYTTTLGGSLNVFTNAASVPVNSGTLDLWYTPGLSTDFTPSSFKNNSGGTLNGVLDGEAALHSGPAGQYAVARFVMPESTLVDVSGMFKSGDIGAVSVYIYVAGVQVFGNDSTTIDEVFGLSFNAVQGQTIDFIVGTGLNSGYEFDSTPLVARIESVPEPMSLGLAGLAGLLLARRRSL